MNLLFAVLVIPLLSVLASKHGCPGGTFQCDDSATCCQLLDKSYGCCPLKDAVCCDDHIHCCPTNTKCSAGMCVEESLNALKNTSKFAYEIKSKDIVCPGGKYECPDETTCCKGPTSGTYGCCPMADAVCCEDHQHCCPSGTTCNLQKSTCDGDTVITPMYSSTKKLFGMQLSPMIPITQTRSVSSVFCPGSTFQCPDGYTCCFLQSGQYGCCPFPNANCCSDQIHCCPENMQCDATSTHCTQGQFNITSVSKVPAKPILENFIFCPDKTPCQDFMTCCPLSGIKFGCCQYQNATCCSDKLHCCANGYSCDVKNKECVPNLDLQVNLV